jgi:hypothetical protein
MARISIHRRSLLIASRHPKPSARPERAEVTLPRATAGLRKFGLLVHITTSVGWLGAVLGFLALALAATTGSEVEMVRAAFLGMDWTLRYAIVPLSVASIVVGIVQSLMSPWGLLRYWWVVVKLALTIGATLVLLQYTQTMAYLADRAGEPTASISDLRRLALSPLIHAGAGAAVLLGANVLSVYKPRGLTPYGWRWEDEQRRTQLERGRTRPAS